MADFLMCQEIYRLSERNRIWKNCKYK